MIFSGVTILYGVEFPIFLSIFVWALQQCLRFSNFLPEREIWAIGKHVLVSLAKFVLHMHRQYYFRGFEKYSDIPIRFSDPDS